MRELTIDPIGWGPFQSTDCQTRCCRRGVNAKQNRYLSRKKHGRTIRSKDLIDPIPKAKCLSTCCRRNHCGCGDDKISQQSIDSQILQVGEQSNFSRNKARERARIQTPVDQLNRERKSSRRLTSVSPCRLHSRDSIQTRRSLAMRQIAHTTVP